MSTENEEEILDEEITYSELLEMNLDKFLEELTALADNLPFQLMMLSIKHKNLIEKLEKISLKTEDVDDKGKEITKYQVTSEKADEFAKIHKLLRKTDIAEKILPRNYVVSIISQYDAFLGELVKVLYEVNPNILRASEKIINAEEIFSYGSIEDLKNHMIDKEVESILREEHLEQLKVLERRISKVTGRDFTLTTDLPILPHFIELTQRRNLFVHTNGQINRQYLDAKTKWKFESECTGELNEELKAENDYCKKAFEVLFEISVKLTHVLWRKMLPDDRDKADMHLNQIIYDLLLDNKYTLGIIISDFATDVIKKFSSEQIRKFIIINKAIAYKMLNNEKKCKLIIEKEDWSIGNEFKLAKVILEDNFVEAQKIMIKIGADDELINKFAYKNWPLFKRFRKTEEFRVTYKEIFNEDFLLEEIQDKPIVKKENKAETDVEQTSIEENISVEQ